ncbi:MAG: hypothetical protein ACLQPD_24120 [Desulfomonilaceae bacterium]
MRKRFDIKKILSDPKLRRDLIIPTIIATQAREGVTTTYEQAADAYDKIQEEKRQRKRSRKKRSPA